MSTTSTADRLATARAELTRSDQKAGSLLSLALALLAVGLTFGARSNLRLAVMVALWASIVFLAASVVLLTVALRPRLDGINGIAAWARGLCPDDDDEQALLWVSRAALRKYRHICRSIICLWAALVSAALAAILSAALS